jgi:hypothetical protein
MKRRESRVFMSERLFVTAEGERVVAHQLDHQVEELSITRDELLRDAEDEGVVARFFSPASGVAEDLRGDALLELA